MDESGNTPPERMEETQTRADRRPIHRRKWLAPAAGVLIGLVVLLSVLPLQVCRDRAFVCEPTGSRKGYRQWCAGLPSGEWYRESRLEQFMRREHPSDLTYRWTSYQGTGRDILGLSRSFQHGRPQIDTIMLCPAWFDRYVDTLEDDAKLALYRLLVSGDREAIRAEVKKIEEMALAQAWDLR